MIDTILVQFDGVRTTERPLLAPEDAADNSGHARIPFRAEHLLRRPGSKDQSDAGEADE